MSAEQIVESRVPNPFRSLEEYERYWHKDLDRLEYFEIWRELERVNITLAFASGRDIPWLLDRRVAVLDEMERRRS